MRGVRISPYTPRRGGETDIFDIGARVDGDHVTVLDAKVVADDSVDASAAVIELLIGKNDKDRLLSLLAADEHGVASEELERVHSGLGEGDDAVVIVDGIGDPGVVSILVPSSLCPKSTYINWLGFFFFLRIAVAVSSDRKSVV